MCARGRAGGGGGERRAPRGREAARRKSAAARRARGLGTSRRFPRSTRSVADPGRGGRAPVESIAIRGEDSLFAVGAEKARGGFPARRRSGPAPGGATRSPRSLSARTRISRTLPRIDLELRKVRRGPASRARARYRPRERGISRGAAERASPATPIAPGPRRAASARPPPRARRSDAAAPPRRRGAMPHRAVARAQSRRVRTQAPGTGAAAIAATARRRAISIVFFLRPSGGGGVDLDLDARPYAPPLPPAHPPPPVPDLPPPPPADTPHRRRGVPSPHGSSARTSPRTDVGYARRAGSTRRPESPRVRRWRA